MSSVLRGVLSFDHVLDFTALFRFCRAFLLSSIIIPTERINASDGLKTAIKSVLCFLSFRISH